MSATTLWLYNDGSGPQGPVSENDIVELVRTGQLPPSGSLRVYGPDGAWLPLSEWAPGGTGAVPASAQQAWSDTAPHPWRRYFARLLDNLLIGTFTFMPVAVIFYIVAPFAAEEFFAVFDGPGGRLVDIFLTTLFAIPGTALMIGLTGTSPGKWIFGVKIVGRDGNPIGFLPALKREFGVWIIGFGAGLPLISLITLISAFNNLKEERITPWDKTAGAKVLHRREGSTQTLLIFVGIVTIVAVQLLFLILERSGA